MKFIVEINDFWIEEDELSAALARTITNDIVMQMKAFVNAKIDEQIGARVQKVIDDHISAIIAEKLDELIETGTIVRNGKVVEIKQHISNLFNQSTGWNQPSDKIASLAKQFGEELKRRYDAAFANRIVVKLNEQGMLKDEVVKLLIQQ